VVASLPPEILDHVAAGLVVYWLTRRIRPLQSEIETLRTAR
jgi:hypothetical protein